MKAYSIKALKSDLKGTNVKVVWNGELHQYYYDFFEKLEYDLGHALTQVFHHTGECGFFDIDRFIIFKDKIWAINSDGINHFELSLDDCTRWCKSCGPYAVDLTALEQYDLIEINSIDEKSYQIYLFLLMYLRVSSLDTDYVENLNEKALYSLELLCSTKLFYTEYWHPKFSDGITLFDAIEKLNSNNPARYYLDALTKYPKLNIYNCHEEFSFQYSSQIIFDILDEYLRTQEKVRFISKKKDAEKEESDKNRSYNLVKNENLVVSEYSCTFKDFFRDWKYSVTVHLFNIDNVLNIAYAVSSGGFINDIVKEIKNDKNMSEHFTVCYENNGNLVVEKILNNNKWEFCQVLKEVFDTMNSLIDFLKNDSIFFDNEGNEEHSVEFWSSEQLADYYGYQYDEDYSYEQFLDDM